MEWARAGAAAAAWRASEDQAPPPPRAVREVVLHSLI